MQKCNLALEFDINQITRSLQYSFQNAQGSAEEGVGSLAGTYHFQENDQLSLSVTATGHAQDEITLDITDCTLVSVSTANLGESYLSLFSQSSAVTSVPKWSGFEQRASGDPNRVKLVASASKDLVIAAPTGQWEISGYLSVQIILNGKTYNRVFFFDPESTSGTGGGFGWPDNR